jgi:hypothetical protein
MTLYKCGTKAKADKIEGFITGINITGSHHIQYEFSYWSKDELKKIWLDDFQLTVEDSPRLTIGFRNG